MNSPYSPISSTPPPLPKGILSHHPQPSKRTRLVLTASQAVPYRKASAVIGLFSIVACLLTYKTGWGINLPLLAAAAIGVGFWRQPQMLAFTSVRLQLVVWTFLAVAVVLHFDPWTIVPFLLVNAVLLGGLLFGTAVDPMRGLARMAIQMVSIPWAYIKAIRYGRASIVQKNGVFSSVVRLAAFPTFIALGFGTLYVWSNRTLSQWSFNFFDQMLGGSWFVNSLHIIWSLFVASLFGAALVYGMNKQDARLLKSIGISPAKLAASASKWSSVSVALVLVNVLALVLNTVDGATTWIGEVSTSAVELTRGVHAGTYTLITAIVLAAGYLLYNFRVQPKDYERARVLAMAWLGQNLMMCFTVGLRNYHYTDAYGLTIKRIGVWLFLCCTATGLYFLSRQVRENGSIERLVRRQAWAVYLVLATAAIPNWPGLITHYNFQEARLVLDKSYLSTLRPYNLDVWAEYNPSIVDYSHLADWSYTHDWVAPVRDFRAWDYREARRSAMREALPVKVKEPVEKVVAPTELLEEVGPQVDLSPYEVEPVPEEESNSPRK